MLMNRRSALLGATALTLVSSLPRTGKAFWHGVKSVAFGKVNLNLALLDVGTLWPFIDRAKQCTDIALIVSGVGYGTGLPPYAWSQGIVDANGQPNASIPGCTFIGYDIFRPTPNLYNGQPPAGYSRTGQAWVCTWTGDNTGTIQVLENGSPSAGQIQSTNRIDWIWGLDEVNYDFHATGFNSANCPRNFHCYLLSNEADFLAGKLFDSGYTTQVALGAGRLRTKDWRSVIEDEVTNTFAAIPSESYWSWAFGTNTTCVPGAPGNMNNVPGGTPATFFYKLSNQLNKHAYINVPKQMGNGKAVEEQNITGISNANPCVITCPGHPFVNGDQIVITHIDGMTQLNNQAASPGLPYTVASATSTTFALSGINSIGFGSYIPKSGRIWSAYSLSGMTTQIGLLAAMMRDNLNPGLYTCVALDNENWIGTPNTDWLTAQNQIYPHNPGGGSQQNFWGYIMAHIMRIFYDTYGASKRSQWKGLFEMFAPNGSGYLNDIYVGVQSYLSDFPAYTFSQLSGGAYLFDELTPASYFGASTLFANGGSFNPAFQSQTVTITATLGQPLLVTLPPNTLFFAGNNCPVKLTTTGTLPAPLTPGITGFPTGEPSGVGNVFYTRDTTLGIDTCHLAASIGGPTIICTNATQSGVHTISDCPADIALQWIIDSVTKFNGSITPTRYDWFDQKIAAVNFDGGELQGAAQQSSIAGIIALFQSSGNVVDFANAHGLQVSTYEGGVDILPFGGALLSAFNPSTSPTSSTDTVTMTNVGGNVLVTYAGGTAPANGTPISYSGGVLPSLVQSGVIVFVTNKSGATCNISATFNGSSIAFTGSSSGTILCQAAFAEFWKQTTTTARNGVNEVAMFTQFSALAVSAGAHFPAKFNDVEPTLAGGPWGALQFLGNGVNDSTPTWTAIKNWNSS